MPKILYMKFQKLWNLDDETCSRIFIEYAKFLTLIKLGYKDLCPSFWVDQLWHEHMLCSDNYRDTCINIFEKLIPHKSSGYTEEDQIQAKKYFEATLLAYTDTFGALPPQNIWNEPKYEEIEKEYSTINLCNYII